MVKERKDVKFTPEEWSKLSPAQRYYYKNREKYLADQKRRYREKYPDRKPKGRPKGAKDLVKRKGKNDELPEALRKPVNDPLGQ